MDSSATSPQREQPEDTEKRQRIVEQYGKDIIDSSMREKIRRRQVILRPEQFDDDAVIDALEKSVAYNRDQRTVTAIHALKSATATPNLAPAAPERIEGKSNTINLAE